MRCINGPERGSGLRSKPFLDKDAFRAVVAATPLASIDLIVENAQGEILLGQRNNRPAAGFWFVPGGRIRKNEPLDEAFLRLTQEELGVHMPRSGARLLGVYEHMYEDSVFGDGVDTHYVVLGYQLRLDLPIADLPDAQHSGFRWWPRAEMAESALVHDNSRAYLAALA